MAERVTNYIKDLVLGIYSKSLPVMSCTENAIFYSKNIFYQVCTKISN